MEDIVSKAYFEIKSVDRRLSRGVRANSLVLDVGCGTGIDVLLMAERGAVVVGLDIGNDVPLTQASKNVKNFKPGKGVDFIKASATNIPFRDDTFDTTTSFSVIDHLPTKKVSTVAIQEMARVTKLGGDVIITCPNALFFIGTVSRWILAATRSWTFFEQRFTPTELKRDLLKSGLEIQEFDSDWPILIDRITIDNRVPPFLRRKIPIQAVFPILKIFRLLRTLSIFKVCGARIGYRAKKAPNYVKNI